MTRTYISTDTIVPVGSTRVITTPQAALQMITDTFDIGPAQVFVELDPETFPHVMMFNAIPGGRATDPTPVVLRSSTAGMATLDTTGPGGINLSFAAKLGFMKLRFTGAGDGVYVSAGAVGYDQGACDYGPLTGPTYHKRANQGGTLICYGDYTISGGASCHLFASGSANIEDVVGIVTITGTPVIPNFAYARGIGGVFSHSRTYVGGTIGQRYWVEDVVSAIGVGAASPTYFPGTLPGGGPGTYYPA